MLPDLTNVGSEATAKTLLSPVYVTEEQREAASLQNLLWLSSTSTPPLT